MESWLFVPSGNSVKCFAFLIESYCPRELRSQVLHFGVSHIFLFFNVDVRGAKMHREERMQMFVTENTHKARNISLVHKVKNIWVNSLHVSQAC